MSDNPNHPAQGWMEISRKFLPFADAATPELPLPRLLRLALFQISVGMAIVLLYGTLNRVMIVELGVPVWLVSLFVALPLLFAPFRAFIGFRSDTHRSALGWRRVPYLWMGTLLQWGGLAFMPFALIAVGGDTNYADWVGYATAGLAFLAVGAGLHTTQTAGLALATDLAPVETRPRVVALLYVMLLLGMVGSALMFGLLLDNYTHERLIRVVQGAAVVTLVLNVIALWKQEARDRQLTAKDQPRPAFRDAWRQFMQASQAGRFLVAVGFGTAAFSMQDVLLEPYGGQILGLSVAATTKLTAGLAGGNLVGFAFAARSLTRGSDPQRLAALGAVIGLPAFMAVIAAAPLDSGLLFRAGTVLIGLGSGLFAVGTLTAAMGLHSGGQTGLALGAWGAVQASAMGGAIALGGAVRDMISSFASQGVFGPALTGPAVGYTSVYLLEIVLLVATLVTLGPLVRHAGKKQTQASTKFGIAEFPG